jgi:hypothetical protein
VDIISCSAPFGKVHEIVGEREEEDGRRRRKIKRGRRRGE